MTKKFIKDTELVPAGYSNGISTQLARNIENNGPKAQLSSEEKERLKTINGEIAVLQTQFSQNVLKEVNALAVVVDTKAELDGLSESAIDAAAEEAEKRELSGKYVLALKNTSGQPPMSSLTNRALRERIHKTSLSRGSRGGEFDNRENLTKVLRHTLV